MPLDEQPQIAQEIAALRREMRSLRRWVIFTALCAGCLLFGPLLIVLLAKLQGTDNFLSGLIAPIAGIAAVILIAAIILSRSAPPRDKDPVESEQP